MGDLVARATALSSERGLSPRGRRRSQSTASSPQEDDEQWDSHDEVEPQPPTPKVQAKRNLKWWDVSSLIINKMIGTGIFTGPALVMNLTRNKSLTISFWIVGFVYTLMSMCLYLEFARRLPYTGGELVYLDCLWRRRPRLLFYTWYTIYFVTLYTTCSNSLQFAKQVLITANGLDAIPNRELIGFIAFTVTSAVCLLLYFDSQTSRLVIWITALAKVILLLVVIGAGCRYAQNHYADFGSWTQTFTPENGTHGEVFPNWDQSYRYEGLLQVFFSYHGWENATFVAGDIPKYRVLRTGFIVAVVVVGSLYVSIAALFCAAYPSSGGGDGGKATQKDFETYVALFFENSDAAQGGTAIVIALSSVGSMLSIAYTAVRVKQVMGWVNILPLSNLWRRTSLSHLSRQIRWLLPSTNTASTQAAIVRKGTPEGGIILHYIISIIHIGISQAIRPLNTAITVQGTALIYGHFFIEVVLGIGYAFSFEPLKKDGPDIVGIDWDAPLPYPWFTKHRRGMVALGLLVSGVSSVIIALELLRNIGRLYLAVVGGITLVAIIYWLCLVFLPADTRKIALLGVRIVKRKHGKDELDNAWRKCSQCSQLSDDHAHRHREDGYLHYNRAFFTSSFMGQFARWMAGGFGGETKEDLDGEVLAATSTSVEMTPQNELKRSSASRAERGEIS